ncbi:MAG: carbon storage regulator [Candidatus Andersenbacteria bacterium]|nr:carbon storage regulator [Candidatus Andersenbacteria bacterium]MBI3250326.1 carbon storage regulator [Candidatus Andersenbacteria bacterium]
MDDQIFVQLLRASEARVKILVNAPNLRVVRGEILADESSTTPVKKSGNLVLTRKPGQVFWILPSIRIMVTAASGGSAKFGIEAPKEIMILREELMA